jgi:hypothetical protein
LLDLSDTKDGQGSLFGAPLDETGEGDWWDHDFFSLGSSDDTSELKDPPQAEENNGNTINSCNVTNNNNNNNNPMGFKNMDPDNSSIYNNDNNNSRMGFKSMDPDKNNYIYNEMFFQNNLNYEKSNCIFETSNTDKIYNEKDVEKVSLKKRHRCIEEPNAPQKTAKGNVSHHDPIGMDICTRSFEDDFNMSL